MRLYHVTANGPFGPFGDYIWARCPKEAVAAFKAKHSTNPNTIRYEHA